MDQNVVVTPAQLTRFAEFLEESTKRLRNEANKLGDAVGTARVIWKDAKYEDFHRKLNASLDELEKFNSTGLKYAEFLREKALLANKYLHRG